MHRIAIPAVLLFALLFPAAAKAQLDLLGRIDTIGGTTFDCQANGPGVSTVHFDSGYGVHVAWTYSADLTGGFTDRRVRYNYYDILTPGWSYRTGTGYMYWGVSVLGLLSGFASMDVNATSHCAYIGCHRGDTARATVVRSSSPGSSTFTECPGPARSLWPVIGLTGSQRVHVALVADSGVNNRTKLYHARVDPWGTWSTPVAIYGSATTYPGFPQYGLAASKLSPRVTAVWSVSWRDREPAFVTTSTDDGATWPTPTQLAYPATFSPGSETLPSFDPSSLYPFYDSRDSLHIAAAITPAIVSSTDTLGHVFPAEIWHWSSATGWDMVTRIGGSPSGLAGNIGYNSAFAGRPTICQGGADEFVCVWEEFNPTNVESSTGQLRADIFGARSTDAGNTWHDKTRVTDPDLTSKRFPSVAGRMKDDTVIIAYLVDQVAGSAVLGQGAATSNTVVVQWVPKADFRVPIVGPDVCVERIMAPAGNVMARTSVTPACSVYNIGTTTASYEVRMLIGTAYDSSATVTGHAPGTHRLVQFPAWTAEPNGTLDVVSFTRLDGDLEPGNDTAQTFCTVVPAGTPGWSEVGSMPLPPSGKPVKRGGWLEHNPSSGLLYGQKGYKTNDFYYYHPLTDLWMPLTGMPFQTHPLWSSRPPRKGSKGVSDGGNVIYVTQGNNTLGFWSYHIAEDSWAVLEDVPLGPYRKKVKGGTDMVYVPGAPGYVYLLKGYKNEFHRYNTVSGKWETLPNAPVGVRQKWYKGSWLCLGPQPGPPDLPVIYAHKAKYHELWTYDLTAQQWDSLQLAGMPYIGMMSRRKKSKDGGSAALHDGRIFALKGGNTQEFWMYDPATDEWTELDTMPAWGSTGRKKRVKYGADIVSCGGGTFYALKGNKTTEMWRYILGSAFGAHPPEAVAASLAGSSVAVRIMPNPARQAAVVSYSVASAGRVELRLYDVNGRLAAAASRTHAGAGAYSASIDVAGLASGVYVLTYDSKEVHETRKLVIGCGKEVGHE